MIKKFIKKLLLFLSPILLGLYPLDLWVSSTLKNSNAFNGEIEVWEAIKNGKANCDIAVYGTSRAWLQFDPEVLSKKLGESVYNFGIDGHNFWLQYYRHLQLLKYNKTPQKIILSVDIFTLEKREDLYNLEQFLPYMLWNMELRKHIDSYKGFQNTDYLIPFFRYAGKGKVLREFLTLIKTSRSNDSNTRNRGFRPMDLNWGDKNDAVSDSFEYVIKLHKPTLELFEKFVAQCKANGIELILVYAPEQLEGQNRIKNINLILNFYKEISDKYQILYLDYSKDDIHLDKNYFYNSMHLNRKGANIFSEKLANELKLRMND